MRIGSELPAIYFQAPAMINNSNQPGLQQPGNSAGPGFVVDISPAGWAAYQQSMADEYDTGRGIFSSLAEAIEGMQCATCDSRRYQDDSDDSSVSFQMPTHISPGASASKVAAHESEHVANEQARAEREGREIIYQSVSLRTSICPECRVIYVSGGETRTISRQNIDLEA